MRCKVFVVGVLSWILGDIRQDQALYMRIYLFCAHEEKMLHGMGHTWHVILVTEAADIDVYSSASFVGVRIVNEKSFELVGQSNNSV